MQAISFQIQNIGSSLTDAVTKERCYAVAFAVSTVALCALSFYAPILFSISSISLGIVNVLSFSEAARHISQERHAFIRNWMILACFITSTVLGVALLRTLPLFLSAAGALKAVNLSGTMWRMAIATGMVGLGIPAMKATYQRGLELLQKGEWTSMKKYLEQSPLNRQLIHTYMDYIQFYIAIIDPEITSSFNIKIKLLTIPFISDERKEKSFSETIRFLDLYPDLQEKIQVAQLAMIYYAQLPEDLQWKLFPELSSKTRSIPRAIIGFPPHILKRERAKIAELEHNHNAKIVEFQEAFERLDADIARIIDAKTESEEVARVSKELHLLRNEITNYCREINAFSPNLNSNELIEIQRNLGSGELIEKVNKLNRVLSADDEKIDRTEDTFAYLTIQYRDAQEKLKSALGVETSDEMDAELVKYKIGTMGEFIDQVLDGEETIIKDENAVFAKLESFINESKENTRFKIYSFFSGPGVHHSTKLMGIIGKISYRATLILTAVAPIVAYPTLSACGAIAGVVYYTLPPLPARIQNWLFNSTDSGHYLFSEWMSLYRIVTRRPFFSLFSSEPREMTPFNSADFFGKMRILSLEFFICFGVLISQFPGSIGREGEGVGSILQGIAIGREASSLLSRTYTRIRG